MVPFNHSSRWKVKGTKKSIEAADGDSKLVEGRRLRVDFSQSEG